MFPTILDIKNANVAQKRFFQNSRNDGTAKNIVISPNFVMWKFWGKAQFQHSFGRVTRNYAEIVLSIKLRYFSQCRMTHFNISVAVKRRRDNKIKNTPLLFTF